MDSVQQAILNNSKTCVRGHDKVEENAYWRRAPNGKWWWECRECRKLLHTRSDAKRSKVKKGSPPPFGCI